MKVKVLEEAGYEWALLGLSKSFKDRAIPHEEWWTHERFLKLDKTAKGMAFNDGGHNKFLESITVWIDIEAPRGWWQEFDTYRVGMTKQSDSTMHTIQRRLTTEDDYEPGTEPRMIITFNKILHEETAAFTNTKRLTGKSLQRVKWNLPEGYLQSRVVCLNYKTLRGIFLQRWNHSLEQWQTFINEMRKQLERPELLPSKGGN
jgi:hypothetical protein